MKPVHPSVSDASMHSVACQYFGSRAEGELILHAVVACNHGVYFYSEESKSYRRCDEERGACVWRQGEIYPVLEDMNKHSVSGV